MKRNSHLKIMKSADDAPLRRPRQNDTPTDEPLDSFISSDERERMRTSAMDPNESYTDMEAGRRSSSGSRSAGRERRSIVFGSSLTRSNRSIAAARPVNTSDMDRVVNQRVEQILRQERERAAVAQIAENTVEPPSTSTSQAETKPKEAVDDKKGMYDPDGWLIVSCITLFGPRGRLLAVISAIFGTAAIIVAIIYLATRE